MIIKLLVNGGEMKPTPALSQKMGPLGMNMGKIISDVNKATENFRGIKVPVTLDIDTKTKNFKISVSNPPTSELLKKELGIQKASGMPDKIKVANVPIEHIIKIAKIKQEDMLVKSLKEAVNSVLGSCVSLGILVEGKNPKEIIQEIAKGNYKREIENEITEASDEKIEKLQKEFDIIKRKQEALIKEIEEKKAAAAAPATAEQGASTEGATPAPTTAAPKEEAKGKSKK